MKDIRLERFYPHPIERVWTAIATSKGIGAWLMPNDFEPRLGHRFQLRWKKVPGWRGYVECEVLEIAPPHRLVYSWKGDEKKSPQTVRWTLEAKGDGTRLLLEHDGFQGFGDFFGRIMMASGWKKKFKVELPAALEVLATRGPTGLVDRKP